MLQMEQLQLVAMEGLVFFLEELEQLELEHLLSMLVVAVVVAILQQVQMELRLQLISRSVAQVELVVAEVGVAMALVVLDVFCYTGNKEKL
jgi:ABC-type tungstate transport system substrate-binding protein